MTNFPEPDASYRFTLDGQHYPTSQIQPTVAQLKAFSNLDPRRIVFQVGADGQGEHQLRDDQKVDLSQQGVEHFISRLPEELTDRQTYEIQVDANVFPSIIAVVTGTRIREMAGLLPTAPIYRQLAGQDEVLIHPDDVVDLAPLGIERFVSSAVVVPVQVTVTVNETAVRVTGPRATGRAIKEAAITQGVVMDMNFVLQEELPNRRTLVIADHDEVTVTAHSRFLAIAPDDNS